MVIFPPSASSLLFSKSHVLCYYVRHILKTHGILINEGAVVMMMGLERHFPFWDTIVVFTSDGGLSFFIIISNCV
jgi:hypothetical protein